MRRLLEAAGFEIISCRFTYEEQYFSICAKAHGNPKTIEKVSCAELNRIKQGFADMQKAYDYCKNYYIPSENDCVWGCSGKGVMWLSLMDSNKILHTIDINPYKQNHFVLKTGHRVESPKELTIYHPSKVFIMNSIYTKEVQKMVDEILSSQIPEFILIEDFIQLPSNN